MVLLAGVMPQIWLSLDPVLASRVTATLVAVSVFSAIFVSVISEQQKRLEALVVTDALTGLPNRMSLGDSLEQAVHQHNRSGAAMTLLMLDLDRFKAINDSLGHDAGDRVLRDIGRLLRQRIRQVDKAFRIGGEEFMVLLYGTDLQNGTRVAEELRKAIADYSFFPDRDVTVSIGVATLKAGEDVQAWIKRSDENLYRAKEQGRNRVAA